MMSVPAVVVFALLCAVGALAYAMSRAFRRALAEAAAAADDARERRYNLLEAIPDGVYTLDEALVITHINEEAERLLGADPGAFVGRELASILSPLASDLVPEIGAARAAGTTLSRLTHFGAADWWIEIRILPAASETVVYLRDATSRKRAEMRLLESDSRLRLVMQQVPAVLWSVDRSGRFSSLTGAGIAALDIDEAAFAENDCALFFGAAGAATVRGQLSDGSPVQFESAFGSRWLRHHVEPLRDTQGAVIGAVGASLDISEVKSAREELEAAARLDALTQLPNRFALEEVLAEVVADPVPGTSCAVLFIDLDRFKKINDTLGHGSGDDVLRVVAERLRSSVDQGDVVARPGGDEFIIVLRSIASLDNVGAVVARLLRRFEEPIFTAGRQLFVNASIGAALAPQHGTTAEELITNADAAMYRAKDSGRGTFRFYDGDMDLVNMEALALENDMRRAIAGRQFVLHYQPIIDLGTRSITGCEALVRWHHPARGMLQPNTFIRLAEEASLIGELTRWVLGEACAFAASVRRQRPDFRVAVNVSASDLHGGQIYALVRDQLELAQLDPAGLELEVTESALVDDTALLELEALRELGVDIAIDDFGTAYNSLLYLKRLPVTTLKIDRVFLEGVARDGFDRSIVKAIVTLGSSLGMRVIAEGIDSAEQLSFVSELSCDEAQGFLFSRAVDAPAFEAMLGAPPDFCATISENGA